MAEQTFEVLLKLPMGKKEGTLVIDEKGDGTFSGTFTVLDSTAPLANGTIDSDGIYHADCTITTILGTTDMQAEWKIIDGLVDGYAKNRMGRSLIKSPELW